jgi:hypothetical protein
VERHGTTLLMGDAAAVGFDTRPLCGNKLARAQAEQAQLRLLKGSASGMSKGGIEK